MVSSTEGWVVYPVAEGLLEAGVKPGKTLGRHQPEGFLPGISQGITAGEEKRHQVPHVVGMAVAQGQDVNLVEIETPLQHGA